MPSFVIVPAGRPLDFERPLLGATVADCIAASIEEAGYPVHYSPEGWPGAQPDSGPVVAVLAPAPLLTPADWQDLAGCTALPARLVCEGQVLAVAGPAGAFPQLLTGHAGAAHTVEVPLVRGLCAVSARALLGCQEALRQRVNGRLLDLDVMLMDPGTTYVSPRARIEPGCQLLPGCHIYGNTTIGPGSVIGPNCMLQDAVIGGNVRVNTAQIVESTVGQGTTVGPFANIRPGCAIGENVRIGDFVELKNSKIGKGTKVSHLTYLGDSDFGEHINVGCGVVTSNYDGYQKHRTRVGDNSFIGCNVNLVPPVEVEADTYLAAGTTITDPVPAGSLAIGRARQENKPGWVARWREKNKK